MSLISQKLGLLNGVSQKPQEQRLSSQAQDQTNGLSHLIRGLMMRPPLVWIGRLTTTLTGWSSAFIHPIVRSATERYHVAVVNSQVLVFDAITQLPVTVTARTGFGYLAGDGGLGFRAATAGDTTIIVNRGKTVRRGTTKSASLKYEALVFVRQADYSTIYSVTINGKAVAIKTVDQSTPSTREAISTDTIAANLMTALQSAFSSFTFTQYGSTIYIVPTAADTDFTLSVADGLADGGLKAVKGSVQLFEDLPPKAPDGFTIEVAGDPESDKDNYWLRFDSKGTHTFSIAGHAVQLASNGQEGVWRECPKPGTLLSLDATTLPYRLTRMGSIVHDVIHEGIAAAFLSVADIVRNAGLTTYSWSNLLDGTAIAAGANATVQDNATGMKKVPGVAGASFQVTYYVDSSQLPAGETAIITVLVNTTPVYTANYTNNTGTINTGVQPFDGSFMNAVQGLDQVVVPPPPGTFFGNKVVATIQQAITNTDTIKVQLTYASGVTPTTYRRASLSVTPSSLVVADVYYKRINILGDLFPLGTVVSATLDGSNTFNYTVTGSDQTGAQVATGLGALIDASATYIVTANSSGVVIDVRRTDGLAFSGAAVSVSFAESTIFHSSTMSLTPNELVGKTMKNLTDGSSGTVSSNTATTIVVSSLSGGADNKFKRGDICSVVGAGTYFVFEPCPWNNRGAGDDVTNPFPSFVDNTISDVVFYQDRLGFCSNENVVFSASGDVFNFFRFTATQLLPDDVIDVRASSKEVALFDAFIPWGGSLYAKSSNAQWLISGEPALTPTTIRIDLVSRVLNDSGLPAILGNRVYMFRGKGGFAQIQEFTPADSVIPQLNFLDITQDSPRYIPGSPLAIVGDDSLGFLAVLTNDSSQRNLYVYSYAFQGTDRAQSSWSKWTFASGSILGMDIVDGKLGLIVLHTGSVEFYQIDLNVALDTLDADEAVRHLDRRYTQASSGVSSAYNAGSNTTTWTLPVNIATDGSEGSVIVVNRSSLVTYTTTRPAANQVAVTGQGDLTGASVYIGVSYAFSYTPSRIFMRRQEEAETGGWLTIRNLKINYRDTTNFTVTVTLAGRATPWTYTFSNTNPSTDEFHVPVQGRNTIATIIISNATPGGCAFSSIDWEGSFTMRSQRV